MADRRLAAVGGFLFCALLLVLILVLYFPDTAEVDDDSEYLWTPRDSTRTWKDFEFGTDSPESRLERATRLIEDMGASFLALLAVFCVATGLACLTCACCCL